MLSTAAIPISLARRLRSGLSPMTPLTGGNPNALDAEALVMRNTHRFGSQLHPLLAYDPVAYPQRVLPNVASAIEDAVNAEAANINAYLAYTAATPSPQAPVPSPPSVPGTPSVPSTPSTPSTPSAPNTPSPGAPGTPSPPLPPVVLFPPSPGSGGSGGSGGGQVSPSPSPSPSPPRLPRVFVPLGPPRRSPSPVAVPRSPSPGSPVRAPPPPPVPPALPPAQPPAAPADQDARPLSPFYAQALQYMTNNEPIMARLRAAVLCASHHTIRAEARAQLTAQGAILTKNMRYVEKETQTCDFLGATRRYREIRETLLRIYQSYYRCMGATGAEVKEIDPLGRPILKSAVDTRH